MAHGPTELIILVFDDASKADQALQELKELKQEKLIKIEDAAVLTRTADGKARVKDIHDLGGGKGALLGAIGGALVSLVVGPLGLIGMTAAGPSLVVLQLTSLTGDSLMSSSSKYGISSPPIPRRSLL